MPCANRNRDVTIKEVNEQDKKTETWSNSRRLQIEKCLKLGKKDNPHDEDVDRETQGETTACTRGGLR